MSTTAELREQLRAAERAERKAKQLELLRKSPKVVQALRLRDEGKSTAEISEACGMKSSSWWSTTAKKLGEPSVLQRTYKRAVKPSPKLVQPILFPQHFEPRLSDEMLWATYMAAAMTAALSTETVADSAGRADAALQMHRERYPRV